MASSGNSRDLLELKATREHQTVARFGWAIVGVGIVFGIVTIFALTSYGPKLHGGYFVLAMTVPALFILIGLLIMGRAKLALWLMYLLAADLIYTFSLQLVHALKTRQSDDVYGALLDLIWVGLWLSIVTHFHNRRQMFTGFWCTPLKITKDVT